MAKSALPLVLGVGAAALLFMPKSKSKAKSKSSNVPGVVDSGTANGWSWRVRKIDKTGFASQYIGEIKSPNSSEWVMAFIGGRTSAKEAKNLSLEQISIRSEQDQEPIDVVLSGSISGFDWRVRKVQQSGFGPSFFGDISEAGTGQWTTVTDGRSNPDEARLLSWEKISDAQSA